MPSYETDDHDCLCNFINFTNGTLSLLDFLCCYFREFLIRTLLSMSELQRGFHYSRLDTGLPRVSDPGAGVHRPHVETGGAGYRGNTSDAGFDESRSPTFDVRSRRRTFLSVVVRRGSRRGRGDVNRRRRRADRRRQRDGQQAAFVLRTGMEPV